jgi:uncharacterized protein (TIGR03083 family)
VDHRELLREDTSRIIAAYEQNRGGKVPWSDRWSVATVARHVASTHHVVAQIVQGRPDADFGLFASLAAPDKNAPEFAAWFANGTDLLIEQLHDAPPNDQCWNWHEGHSGQVKFWSRRMVHETAVHRWDAQMGATSSADLVDHDVAIDGIDEFLDVFVAAGRARDASPAASTVLVQCTDSTASWTVTLPHGGRDVARGDHSADVTVRGAASDLLLFLWGRADERIEVSGQIDDRRTIGTLLPSL